MITAPNIADAGAVSIGTGCTIGHHAIVHGCTLGDNVLVGMGATVLNGATIGNYCLVGANALIIGSPAKAVRTLTAEEIASLRASAERYVSKARGFAAGPNTIG